MAPSCGQGLCLHSCFQVNLLLQEHELCYLQPGPSTASDGICLDPLCVQWPSPGASTQRACLPACLLAAPTPSAPFSVRESSSLLLAGAIFLFIGCFPFLGFPGLSRPWNSLCQQMCFCFQFLISKYNVAPLKSQQQGAYPLSVLLGGRRRPRPRPRLPLSTGLLGPPAAWPPAPPCSAVTPQTGGFHLRKNMAPERSKIMPTGPQ